MMLTQVATHEHDGVVVATITGDVDSSNVRDVHRQLLAKVSNEARGAVIDLGPTRYLDSAGISLLFELHVQLATRRQELRLVVGDGVPVRRVLALTAVDQTMPVDATVEAALGAFAS